MNGTAYEACRVRIRWLQAGEVAFESEIDDAHDFFDNRNIVCWLAEDGWHSTVDDEIDPEQFKRRVKLDKEAIMHALIPDWNRDRGWLVHDYSPNNPVVEVTTACTIFEFDPGDVGENWLAYEMGEGGAAEVFGKYLAALENIGLWLWRQGQAVDRDRWGVSVAFHAVWEYHIHEYLEGDVDVNKTFHGWLDMRKALANCCSIPPKVERPERNTLARHRTLFPSTYEIPL